MHDQPHLFALALSPALSRQLLRTHLQLLHSHWRQVPVFNIVRKCRMTVLMQLIAPSVSMQVVFNFVRNLMQSEVLMGSQLEVRAGCR